MKHKSPDYKLSAVNYLLPAFNDHFVEFVNAASLAFRIICLFYSGDSFCCCVSETAGVTPGSSRISSLKLPIIISISK